MGVALAKACYFRGAHVSLIYGNGSANVSDYIDTKRVKQYDEMYEQVFLELKNGYDMVISAAAISDFIVENSNQSKLSSKVGHTIKLIPAKKIIKEIKSKYPKIFVVGFKAEYDSDRLLEKAHDALTDANMDLIVANDLSNEDSGFISNTNYGFVLDRKKHKVDISKCDKLEFADRVLDVISDKEVLK